MFTVYYNDRVSNNYEAHTNFEIFLIQWLPKRHMINCNCEETKQKYSLICDKSFIKPDKQSFALRVNLCKCVQSRASTLTQAGKVPHVSCFHYWKYPKNIEVKANWNYLIFTLWYVSCTCIFNKKEPQVTTLGGCNRVKIQS